MLKKIALVVGVLFFALVAFVATRPDDFSLSRSAVINAAPDACFAQVNDFHNWGNWSPWDKMDGDKLKRTYAGAPAGVGATYAWAGDKTGEGHMEIKDSVAGQKVVIALDFIKPFPANNTTTFTFAPGAGGTTVTWTMSGKNDVVAKAFSLFFDMEKMVGPDFEKGLAAMKSTVEADAKKGSAPSPN